MIPKPEKRIYNFERYGLGLFIHYGLYSLLGQGEWALDLNNIPMEEYEKLERNFTAENFNTEEIVTMAKNAGMKYITLTTRHHDGFSLYDARGLSTFDAPHSPAKRDLIYEFANSCHKHDIVPVMYHTTLDWREPSFHNDFKGYLQYLKESVKILCTEYGNIGGVWFDGNWSRPDDDWQEDDLYSMIRSYQPDAIIVNNTGLDKLGQPGRPEIDCVTFERGAPFAINKDGWRKYLGSEMCEVLNSHWGYAQKDVNYKSLSTIISEIATCRRYGANMLLNVGPKGDGSIRTIDKGFIEEVGNWMRPFSEAIYNVRPSAIKTNYDENFVVNGDNGCLYLFVSNIGMLGSFNVVKNDTEKKNGVTMSGVSGICEEIKWLDNDEKLDFVQEGDFVQVICTPYSYGTNYVVRVAKVSFKK